MKRKIIISFTGILLGLLVGYFLNFRLHSISPKIIKQDKQIVGFLPYWLLSRAKNDYSKNITILSYFSLTIDSDGTIVKLSNPQEKEPGWYALESGKLDPFFANAKKNNVLLSLAVFNGNPKSIDILLSDPVPHAKNLVTDVMPVMNQYGFTDLNLDIEKADVASDEARIKFTQFVKEVKQNLPKNTTLTIDISPTAFIKNYLIDPKEVLPFVDYFLVMGYDYHYQNSFVTGPVAPLFGAETISEFDIQTAVKKALLIVPAKKIILGVPLYGYEWETITSNPRAAVIPGTGVAASNRRVEELLNSCATCSAQFDSLAQEYYVIYKDETSNAYHQIFYPNKKIMSSKIDFVRQLNLGGIGLWALGYEGKTILNPLEDYKNE